MQNIAEIFSENFWFKLSTFEQLAYIGRSVSIAIDWRKKDDQFQMHDEIEKTFKLLELTIVDPKNVKRLREIIVVKELLVDDFCGDNEYRSTNEAWYKYFAFFEHLIKIEKGK